MDETDAKRRATEQVELLKKKVDMMVSKSDATGATTSQPDASLQMEVDS